MLLRDYRDCMNRWETSHFHCEQDCPRGGQGALVDGECQLSDSKQSFILLFPECGCNTTSQLPVPAAMPSLPPTVLSGSEAKQALSPLSYFCQDLLSQQIKEGRRSPTRSSLAWCIEGVQRLHVAFQVPPSRTILGWRSQPLSGSSLSLT